MEVSWWLEGLFQCLLSKWWKLFTASVLVARTEQKLLESQKQDGRGLQVIIDPNNTPKSVEDVMRREGRQEWAEENDKKYWNSARNHCIQVGCGQAFWYFDFGEKIIYMRAPNWWPGPEQLPEEHAHLEIDQSESIGWWFDLDPPKRRLMSTSQL